MKKFIKKIQNICRENKKVAMFIDMDGTITVYEVYPEGNVKEKMEEEYQKAEPIKYIIEILKEINDIPNIDLYILTLAKSLKILKEKQEWLRKYVPFIKEENWIIINKFKEREIVAKLKKVNTILSQALVSAIDEQGTIDTWDLIKGDDPEGSAFLLVNYFERYFKILSNCETKQSCDSPSAYYMQHISDCGLLHHHIRMNT